MLVGERVPSLKGDGEETLRDAQDARDWQEAVKHLLVQEVESRAETRAESLREVFNTVHASIDLFRNNVDLIPGTKQFDKELADQFAAVAKEYELRSGDKLVGYSVPVQPLINQLRQQLAAKRAAAASPPAAAAPAQAAGAAQPSAAQQRAAEQPRTPTGQWTGPQAGVTSKAGQSSDDDNEAQGLYEAFLRQNGITI